MIELNAGQKSHKPEPNPHYAAIAKNAHLRYSTAPGSLRGRPYRPISEAVAQVIDNQKLIADGQQFVEKNLLSRDDGNEEWRQSLSND